MASRADSTKPDARASSPISRRSPTARSTRLDVPTVEARIAASPELSALYERERRVVDALHQARATERAPERLRARIEAARPTRHGIGPPAVRLRRRPGRGARGDRARARAGAAGRDAGRAVGVRRGGARHSRADPGSPRRLTRPIPRLQAVSERRRRLLPELGPRIRWHAVGARTDKLGGRDGGHRLLPVARQADRLHDRDRAGARATGGPCARG